MGWVCPRCGTYNEDSDRECIVCNYDISELKKKQRREKLFETLAKLPKLLVFIMLALTLTAITVNIIRMETNGSVIDTAEERIQYAVQNIDFSDSIARVDREKEYSIKAELFGYRLQYLTGRAAPNFNVSLISRISALFEAARNKTAGQQ